MLQWRQGSSRCRQNIWHLRLISRSYWLLHGCVWAKVTTQVDCCCNEPSAGGVNGSEAKVWCTYEPFAQVVQNLDVGHHQVCAPIQKGVYSVCDKTASWGDSPDSGPDHVDHKGLLRCWQQGEARCHHEKQWKHTPLFVQLHIAFEAIDDRADCPRIQNDDQPVFTCLS